jgi:hypothetical protein
VFDVLIGAVGDVLAGLLAYLPVVTFAAGCALGLVLGWYLF